MESKLREQYDHLTFTGSVPRTFVGSLALAAVSWLPLQLLGSVDEGLNRQILGKFPLRSLKVPALHERDMGEPLIFDV